MHRYDVPGIETVEVDPRHPAPAPEGTAPMFARFLSAVQGSIKGVVNPEEVRRILILAFGPAGLFGAMLTALGVAIATLQQAVPTFTASSFAAMVLSYLLSAASAALVDYQRRLGHGSDPSPPAAS